MLIQMRSPTETSWAMSNFAKLNIPRKTKHTQAIAQASCKHLNPRLRIFWGISWNAFKHFPSRVLLLNTHTHAHNDFDSLLKWDKKKWKNSFPAERKNSRERRWPSVLNLKIIFVTYPANWGNYFIQAFQLLDRVNHFGAASTGFIHFDWIFFTWIIFLWLFFRFFIFFTFQYYFQRILYLCFIHVFSGTIFSHFQVFIEAAKYKKS